MSKTNILIVGAGQGGQALLRLLSQSNELYIVGVVDVNEKAPGIILAKELRISTGRDFREFLKRNDLHQIINVTGSRDVEKEIRKFASWETEIISGHSAKLMWHLIEERKKMEEEIRESQKRWDAIFRSILTAVVIIDMQKRQIVDCNPLAEKMIGLPKKDIVGQVCHQFICPSEAGCCPVIDLREIVDKSEKILLNARQEEIPILKTVCRVNIKGRDYLIDSFIDIKEQKKLSQKIQENEERLRSWIQNIPGAVYRCANDPGWTMEFLSDEIERLSGYPADDFINNKVRSYASIIHPEDREMVDHVIQEAVQCKWPYDLKYRIIDTRGQIKWVYEKGQALFNEKGDCQWLDGGIFDITDQKKAEIALRSSEERFRVIFESSKDACVLQKPDGTIIDCNEAAVSMYACQDKEELKRQNSAILSAGIQYDGTPSSQKISSVFREIQDKGSCFISWRARRLNGKEFDATVLFSLLEIDGEKIYHAAVRDVTEEKEALKKIEENEQRFRLLNENVSDVIWRMNSDMTFRYFSPSVKKIYGYTPEEACRLRLRDFFDPQGFKEIVQVIDQETRRARESADFKYSRTLQLRNKKKDGSMIWVEINANFLKDRQGNITGLLGVTRDITKRREREEKMKAVMKDLQMFKNAAIDRELKMIELKKEINRLCGESGRPPPYDLSFLNDPLK